jgi:NAD(P)-dependent dehydrogenase (short-subunit alcohol dehydrogenase family)
MTSHRGYRMNHIIEDSMIDNDLVGRTALVTGASRGFGLGVSIALAAAGVAVIGLARSSDRLDAVATEIGDAFTPVAADATDPELAKSMLADHHPDVLVLNAGATPPLAPIHDQTWESFAANWTVDTRHVFEWIRAALRLPLRPGSVVIAVSSGAALGGSPLSGGYAPAKAAIRLISSYAAEESERASLGIRFRTLFPQLTPNTELGAAAVAGYAARQGIAVETFAKNFDPALTPEQVGAAVIELVTTNDPTREFLVSGLGLRQVPS